MHYVLLHDPPPFIKVNFIASNSFVMYWYIRYCYMIHHPSSCIDALCIVTWPTTLHHVLMHYVLLHDPPPFIMYSCIMYCYMTHHPSSCIDALCIVTWPTTLHHVLMHYVLLHDPPPFIMYSCIMYCYMTHHPSSCIDALCIVTWPTTLHHVFMHYVLLHDPPPFIMYWCIMYCYMTHHPSSCIDALCIVTWPTTLHHVLLHYVLLHRAPPFIIVKVIRNSEVLTIPTSFDKLQMVFNKWLFYLFAPIIRRTNPFQSSKCFTAIRLGAVSVGQTLCSYESTVHGPSICVNESCLTGVVTIRTVLFGGLMTIQKPT